MKNLTVRLPDILHTALVQSLKSGESPSLSETVRRALEQHLGVYRPGSGRLFTITGQPDGEPSEVLVPMKLVADVKHFIRQEKFIHAIRTVREQLKVGVKVAKWVCDVLREEVRGELANAERRAMSVNDEHT